jgi:rRNA-processing protein FCF1
MKDNVTITTIKIENSLYDGFKTLNIHRKFSLKDLVIRSMYLFTTDSTFRDRIYDVNIPVLSPEAQKSVLTFCSGSSF